MCHQYPCVKKIQDDQGSHCFLTAQGFHTKENLTLQTSVQLSGMVSYKSRKLEVILIPPLIPDFCDDWHLFKIIENLYFYYWGHQKQFRLPINRLTGSSIPSHKLNGVCNPSKQISGDLHIYQKNLGWSGNSKISDSLSFFSDIHFQMRVKSNSELHWFYFLTFLDQCKNLASFSQPIGCMHETSLKGSKSKSVQSWITFYT